MTYQYYYDEFGTITGKIIMPDDGFGGAGMPGFYVESTEDLDMNQYKVNLQTLQLEPIQ